MELFEKVKQKKLHIILIIAITLLIGIVMSLCLCKKQYISVSKMLLIKSESSADNQDDQINIAISSKLIHTFDELLKSDSTIQEIKSEFNLDVNNNELKKEINVTNNPSSNTFQIEVKTFNDEISLKINKKLLEIFSAKLSEMYENTQLYVVDNPYIYKTVNNISIVISIIISLFIGMLISTVYVFILVIIDRNIKINKDIDDEINLKKLIEIPLKVYKKTKNKNEVKKELISYDSQKSLTSKAFKNLRTNIQFINVNNKNKNIILITSPSDLEGKSYITANLGITFAEVGKKVIIIDSDMKNGRQNQIFNIPNNLGFSNYLSSLDSNGVEIKKLTNNFINETAIKNLNLITSGTVPPNTSDLLTSERLEQLIKDLSVFYDLVLIDGTSVLNNMDALILSRVANSTIFVSDYKKTKKENLLKAKRDVQNVGGKPIGVIINKIKIREKISFEEVKNSFSKKINVIKKFIFKLLDKIKVEINVSLNKVKQYKENKKQKLLMEAKLEKEKNEVKEKEETEIKEIKISKEDNKSNKNDSNKKSKKEEKENVKTIIPEIEIANLDNTKNKQNTINNIVLIEPKNNVISNNNINMEKSFHIKEFAIKNTEIVKSFSINTFSKLKKQISNFKQNVTNLISNIKENHDKTELNDDENQQLTFDNIINENNSLKETTKHNTLSIEEKKESKNINDGNVKTDNTNLIKLENSVKEKNENKKTIKNNIQSKKNKKKKEIKQNESVLIVVDAEEGYCRIFSEKIYVEKMIKGIDQNDGFKKDNYSSNLINSRMQGLISLYGITAKQAKKVDTLVYTTLCDYDEAVWISEKTVSNKADNYVYCMSKNYDKFSNESLKEYELRCKRLRRESLAELNIELEYKLNDILKSNKINLLDKITMMHFAKMYEIDDKLKTEEEIIKSAENIEFYEKIIERFESKSNLEENVETVNSGVYEVEKDEETIVSIDKKIKKEEQKRVREEKRKLRKEKAEKRKEKKIKIKEEKLKKQEEIRKQKEEEKEKQKEEARIEEELLIDNLYPKTKYNRNL